MTDKDKHSADEPVAIHQWRRRLWDEPWYDASKEFAYHRIDEDYEARTLYTADQLAAAVESAQKKMEAAISEEIDKIVADAAITALSAVLDVLQKTDNPSSIIGAVEAMKRAALPVKDPK